MLLDLTAHVATDTPESVSRSVNTDVGPNVGYWFNTHWNYSAHFIRVSVEVASIIWNLELYPQCQQARTVPIHRGFPLFIRSKIVGLGMGKCKEPGRELSGQGKKGPSQLRRNRKSTMPLAICGQFSQCNLFQSCCVMAGTFEEPEILPCSSLNAP